METFKVGLFYMPMRNKFNRNKTIMQKYKQQKYLQNIIMAIFYDYLKLKKCNKYKHINNIEKKNLKMLV